MTSRTPPGEPRRRPRSTLALVLVGLGAVAVVIGVGVALWAWNLPIGRDPYTTLLNSEPGRTNHAIRAVEGGAALAGSGLVVMIVGVLRHFWRT